MKHTDFFRNIGGLNLTDSPFFLKDDQASQGWNYNHSFTGAITKRNGLSLLNASPDTQTYCVGLGLIDAPDGTKTIIRAAGTKLQTMNETTGVCTNLSGDEGTPTTNYVTTQFPVSFAQFSNAEADVAWAVGGGIGTGIYGALTDKVTKNGVSEPTGTFTAEVVTDTPSLNWTTGVYWYSLVLRKTSTQALSNAALDQAITISGAGTQIVTLTFPAVDTTLYDKFYVYRSAVGGVEWFTTGSLVAILDSDTATYDDLNVTFASAQVVPRSGNTTDNGVLPSETFNALCVWKRRLVAATGNTFYISDLNKPESWPTFNNFVIPTGGPIRATGVIGFNTPTTSSSDEVCVLWKDNECWSLTGNDDSDWTLQFVDNAGCPAQSTVVRAKGYIFWMNYDGIYMWGGSGKPIKLSRPIESLWEEGGDLDKSKISKAYAVYYKKANLVIWYCSHKIKGANRIAIKLDLRLTLPNANYTMAGNEMDGVFSLDSTAVTTDDTTTRALTAALSYLPNGSKEEQILVGDTAGFNYKHYVSPSDNNRDITFEYSTKNHDMGLPGVAKRFRKVVAWIDSGAVKDLTLKYWTNYKISESDRSQIVETMDNPSNEAQSLWDVAYWDKANWDNAGHTAQPVVFNLSSGQNNCDGDSIRLQFSQSDADAPVAIHGFTIYWEEMGVRK